MHRRKRQSNKMRPGWKTTAIIVLVAIGVAIICTGFNTGFGFNAAQKIVCFTIGGLFIIFGICVWKFV
jgi:hypothetical protein